jgi:hypothetical protein
VPSADNAVECEDEAGHKPQQHEVTLGVHIRKMGYTKSIRKSDRNCLDAARLVCMTEVRDLPDPGCSMPAACRYLGCCGATLLVWASGKSHSALNQRELAQSYRSAKQQE